MLLIKVKTQGLLFKYDHFIEKNNKCIFSCLNYNGMRNYKNL